MARGDHLIVYGRFAGIAFEHHGIDMGDGTVIHLAPEDGARIAWRDDRDRFCVRRDSLASFCNGRTPRLASHENSLQPDEIATRAESLIGKSGYGLLDNNCEHFATYCCTGVPSSRQVDMGCQASVSAFSMATKVFWMAATRWQSRNMTALPMRVAIKANPWMMLADGVELATLTYACSRGWQPEGCRRVANLSGSITAMSIGAVIAGPGGAVASLALHQASSTLAERACTQIRKLVDRK